jgi:hypothetical protein
LTFWIYIRWDRQSERRFNPFPSQSFSKGTSGTIRCFNEIESSGRWEQQPKHPRLLRSAINGKKKLNFQIKQWAEGFEDVPLIELMESYPWLPEWVWEAVRQQHYRNHSRIKK